MFLNAPPSNISAGKKKIVLKTDSKIRDTFVTNAADLAKNEAYFEFKAPPKPAPKSK